MRSLRVDVAVGRPEFEVEVACHVDPGEVVALVGPNGAGKSTLLRAVAGLEPCRGTVHLGEQRLHDLPARDRQVGLVFQDPLLFGHLSATDNVAFGLRAGGVGRREARTRARALLASWGLVELADRPGRRLSGGEAQRVALARAVAAGPHALLLDEPLAALDARTRLVTRGELRVRLAELGVPTLLVTHDPVDAAVLADRVVVLEQGRVVQEGTPAEVSRRPATDYVARLVGVNLLTGTAEGTRVTCTSGLVLHLASPASGPVHCVVRPTAVSVFSQRPVGSPRNVFEGILRGMAPHGDGVRLDVQLVSGDRVHAEVTPAAVADLGLGTATPLWVAVKANEIEVQTRAG
ncbi:ABC transporter ATP-binding protein [Desertihabitans brevis]|uniref:ABC transporter ATP-binding protein n=1 Tax=Desertihabitans brevis TaxID=2268447 RepID=A0A367YVM1_9ACTN|nr:ABC transporter ATP-binding protein [Desertihabitans brevis]